MFSLMPFLSLGCKAVEHGVCLGKSVEDMLMIEFFDNSFRSPPYRSRIKATLMKYDFLELYTWDIV